MIGTVGDAHSPDGREAAELSDAPGFPADDRIPGEPLPGTPLDRRTRSAAAGLLAVVWAIWGCAEADPPGDPTECGVDTHPATLEEVRVRYMEAFNSGRTEDVVALHADSVVSMPAGMPAVVGREGLRRLLETSQRGAPEGFRFEFRAEEVRRADGWAVERGVTGAHAGAEGPEIPAGKYVLLYERDDDGCWRIVWSITNTDGSGG